MVRRNFFASLFKKWENAKGKDFSIEQEAENSGEREKWDHSSWEEDAWWEELEARIKIGFGLKKGLPLPRARPRAR